MLTTERKLNGNFLRTFGEQMGLFDKLSYPEGLSINRNGDIIVAETSNGSIKIFSSEGEYLRKFGGRGSLVVPCHCIQHAEYLKYLIVSDFGDHSIKMFHLEGNYISKFGKQENKDEEFDSPRYLSIINKQGFLRIFDSENHRVQVFELSG